MSSAEDASSENSSPMSATSLTSEATTMPSTSAPPAGKTPPKPTLYIPTEFFTYVGPSTVGGNSMYKCRSCTKVYSCNDLSRSNLNAHVKSRHFEKFPKWRQIVEALPVGRTHSAPAFLSGEDKVEGGEGPGCLSISRQSTRQPSIIAMIQNRSSGKLRQEQLEDAILEYLVEEVLPLSRAESKGFRKFTETLLQIDLSSPNSPLKLPSRGMLTRRLEHKYEQKKAKLIKILKDVPFVGSTADAWSSRRKGFIGCTLHWIDPDDLTRWSACLCLKRVRKRHTYDVLARKLQEINSEFSLTGKLCGTVTDNSTNFVKAFVVFGEDSDPKSGSGGDRRGIQAQDRGKTRPEHDSEDESNSDENSEEDNVDEPLEFIEIAATLAGDRAAGEGNHDEVGNFSGLDDLEWYDLPKHFRCAAHTLNLVGTKDASRALLPISHPEVVQVFHREREGNFRYSSEEALRYQRLFASVMGKMKGLWNKQQRSTLASDTIHQQLTQLFVVENATRWNSSFRAFERVIKLGKKKLDKMNQLFKDLNLKISLFLTKDIEFINEYVKVVKPLATALDILQGEGAPNGRHSNLGAGYLLPTLQALLGHLREFLLQAQGTTARGSGGSGPGKPLVHCNPLEMHLHHGVQTRFRKQLKDDDLFVAAAVHPNFRLSWLPTSEKGRVTKLVKERAAELRKLSAPAAYLQDEEACEPSPEAEGSVSSDDSSSGTESPGPSGSKKKKRDRNFFSVIQRGSTRQKSRALYEQEIDSYLNDGPDNRTCSLGCLRDLYVKTNTILPSSAPVERLFSLAGRVFVPNRTKLTDAHFEQLLFLRANSNIL